MSHRVFWYDRDHHIIVLECRTPYVTQDFADAFVAAVALIREVDQRVDLILDLEPGMQHTNSNVLGLMQTTFGALPPNLGAIASMGASRFGQMMAEAFTRVIGWRERVFFVHSLDEARAVILAQRSEGGAGPA